MGWRGLGRAGARGGGGRLAAMAIALAAGLLAVLAGEAKAGKYEVAQCGWYANFDANWGDTTGGAKFYPDAWCVPPAGADPFDGVHTKSFTRPGNVTGTHFARWRWQAPDGTGLTQVRASWWHALHDGFQQRLGTDPGDQSFVPFAAADATDTGPKEAVAGFAHPQLAFEDRLLCAKPASGFCNTDDQSWAALRALTITVEDDWPPAAGLGGALLGGGWKRGAQGIVFWTGELGGGDRFQETTIDGARVNLTEYPCQIASIGGEWRGTRMQPCQLGPNGSAAIDTTRISDGFHSIQSCSTDFAGNVGCSTPATIAIDNNPPVHPRPVNLAGGEGWHRVDDFDLTWGIPSQGPASPIMAALYRVTGANGYDSGVHVVEGGNVSALADVKVPGAGAWNLHLWLRDEAGNEAEPTGIDIPLRFDDAPPSLAFADEAAAAPAPKAVAATVADPLAGPAAGTISIRRADQPNWKELPTKLVAAGAGRATLNAPLPDLEPGTWLFRAEAQDAAGNQATTTLRADGTQMAVHRTADEVRAEAAGRAGAAGPGGGDGQGDGHRSKARLFARLRGGRGSGQAVTIGFGHRASVSGRLVSAAGAGLAGKKVRVVVRPSRGAGAGRLEATAKTGRHGGFSLPLGPGTSRRLTVSFDGDRGFAPAARHGLDLRVRSGLTLSASPSRLRTGETVRLSGRVRDRGAAIPRRGKLVAIQYLESASDSWRPVLVTRSDHAGRFHARYRFRYVEGTAAIRLRATALAEERWPYAPGSSQAVTVKVSGR